MYKFTGYLYMFSTKSHYMYIFFYFLYIFNVVYKQNGIFYTIKTGAIQFAKPTFQLPSSTRSAGFEILREKTLLIKHTSKLP